MKKLFIKSIAGLFLLTLFGSTAGFAQTTATTLPESVLPPTVDIFYQMDSTVTNPLTPLFDYVLKSMVLGSTNGDTTLDETDKTVDIVNSALTDNVATFAMETKSLATSNEPDMFITFHADQTELQAILDLWKTGGSYETMDHNGIKIYYDSSSGMALLNDLLVITNGTDGLKNCIDNFKDPSKQNLGKTIGFSEGKKHQPADSFLTVYLRTAFIAQQEELMNEMGPFSELFSQDIMEMIDYEYLSVSQDDDGFNLSALVVGNNEVLAAKNMFFNKYNFVPALYKIISGIDLIAFSESNKMVTRFKDTLLMFNFPADLWSDIDTAKKEFLADSGIDVDTDILPQLDGRNAFFMHKTDQVFPAFTFIFEVRDIPKAANTLAKLVDYLRTELDKQEKEIGLDIYSYQIASVSGTSFYNFNFNLPNFDASLKDLPSASQTVSLYMVINSSGKLVISTHPDPSKIYKNNSTGILDNAKLAAMFTSPDSETSGISYLSGDTFWKWFESLLNLMEAPAEVVSDLGALFAPWHDIFTRDTATATTAQGTITIHVDTEKFSTYPELFEKLADTFESEYRSQFEEIQQIPLFPPINFSDVDPNAWYYRHMNSLVQRGIIKGYDDGTFRPEAQITRAEFITMLMRATGKAMAISSADRPFSDVPPYPGQWYSENVIMAHGLGLVDGYLDGTFKPEAQITRAEAMQIVFNFSNVLKSVQIVDQPLESLIHFSDVEKGDWFLTPVAAGVYFGIINGATPTTFEPNRNLTRAEAAKIIHLFLVKEFPESWSLI